MTHNLRGSVGPFKIFNLGGFNYTVERDGKVLERTDHIRKAYEAAQALNEQLTEDGPAGSVLL